MTKLEGNWNAKYSSDLSKNAFRFPESVAPQSIIIYTPDHHSFRCLLIFVDGTLSIAKDCEDVFFLSLYIGVLPTKCFCVFGGGLVSVFHCNTFRCRDKLE